MIMMIIVIIQGLAGLQEKQGYGDSTISILVKKLYVIVGLESNA